MKVICINLKGNKYITIGRVYDVISVDDSYGDIEQYILINNRGSKEIYASNCFKEISVIRNEKLESIGI